MNNAQAWIVNALQAFAAGAVTWGATNLEAHIPTTGTQWKAFGIGFAMGGAMAVGNWLRKQPQIGGAS